MHRNLFALCIMILISFSSCLTVKQRTGDDYYEQLLYKEAIPYYEYVIKKKYNNEVLIRLANCYRISRNYIKSEQYYNLVVQKGNNDAIYKLYYAEALMQNGKYSDAKKWFDKYLETNRLDTRATRLAESCDSVHQFFKDSALYDVTLLKLNGSTESNYAPAYFRQGIVFASNRMSNELPGKNKNQEDFNLFYAKKTEAGNWLEPELLRGEINSDFQEGPAVFNKSFSTAYVTRNSNDNIKIVTNKRNENVLRIYRFTLNGNAYTNAGEMPFNNPEYSVTHPTLNSNGTRMYFVADMAWGYGGTDIYYSDFSNGSWTAPKNLGKNVNTPGNELFPFLPNDSVLYFSSDGNFTLGGLDIYRSEFIDDDWTSPENIGFPINSSKDDFSLILDSTETTGYFTSNRFNNTDKVFSFKKSPPVFSITGKLLDKAGNKPIKNAVLKILSSDSSETTISTNSEGQFYAKLLHSLNYTIISSEKNYFVSSINISTRGKRKSYDFSQNIVIEKMNMNKAYVWKDIRFDKGDFQIKPAVVKEVDKLYRLLNDNPGLKIELSCHTDSRGSERDNAMLTQKRANAIAEVLFAKGIKRERIIPAGYGELKIINHCKDGMFCLEEEHQANVRTEVKILSSNAF